MNKKLRCGIILPLFALFAQSCISVKPKGNDYGWELPTTSHSLTFPNQDKLHVLWTQEIFVVNSVFKNIQCLSTDEAILLIGSQDPNDPPKVLALDNKSGSLLWEIDDDGVLAQSENGVFIGSGTFVYLVDPNTGEIMWKNQLPRIGQITNMMHYEDHMFVDGSGGFYVLNNDGTIVSTYSQVSEFRSEYDDIPFYPNLPFGIVFDDEIQIVQAGDGLYSAIIRDINSGDELWQVDRNSISNIIILNDRILWISSDSVIEIADKFSGDVLYQVEIDPEIDFFNTEINVQHVGYYLCGNDELNQVYVILGDSRQLFTLSFSE